MGKVFGWCTGVTWGDQGLPSSLTFVIFEPHLSLAGGWEEEWGEGVPMVRDSHQGQGLYAEALGRGVSGKQGQESS